jgi:hypothetical protein
MTHFFLYEAMQQIMVYLSCCGNDDIFSVVVAGVVMSDHFRGNFIYIVDKPKNRMTDDVVSIASVV